MNNIRRIVITGVTRGLGRSLVDRFVDLNHMVYGCGRSEIHIKDLAIRYSSPHRFDSLDISEWLQVENWANKLLNEGVFPDLLVNNAGLMYKTAPLWEISDDEFRNVIETNVTGTANIIRAFLPTMIENGKGIIANMSSGWGRSTAPNVAPYCASKWAIEGMSQALSQELPNGLGVVAVNPGVIDTDILRSCWADNAGGFQSPEEWSYKAADFLLRLSVSDNGKSLSI